jgi:hypothetical protein
MSTKVITLTLSLLLTAGALIPTPAASQDVCKESLGVWELQADDRGGIFIAEEGITVVLFTDADRPRFAESPGTEAERARAFSELYAEVLEWECDEGRLDVVVTHSYHPNRVGLQLKEEFEVDGDVITWWVLQADGTRRATPSGVARRIR